MTKHCAAALLLSKEGNGGGVCNTLSEKRLQTPSPTPPLHGRRAAALFSVSTHCAQLLLLSCALFLFCPTHTFAQRKQISQARDILKKGKAPADAEKIATTLLNDSANRHNKRIYDIWYQAVLQQYLAVNEKLYMKQRQDTARFFDLTYRLFAVAESLDSLDMQADKKGKVNLEYRKANAEQLIKFRPNLFFGGTYHVGKGNYPKAFDFCEAYLGCAYQPLFSGYGIDTTDTRLPEAAYWATYSAYRQKDPVRTLRHRHIALQDTLRAAYTLQYMAEARQWLNDDSLYLETLREGFRRYPLNAWFFPRLFDYYNSRQRYDEALATADSALAANSTSQLYIFAKSSVLFNMQRYDECIALNDRLIEMNDSMPEPHYQAGVAYMNKALLLSPLRDKKKLKATYQEARSYMERYRELAPDEKQKWGPALYRIYLNLNLGRQFDEIDRLLK